MGNGKQGLAFGLGEIPWGQPQRQPDKKPKRDEYNDAERELDSESGGGFGLGMATILQETEVGKETAPPISMNQLWDDDSEPIVAYQDADVYDIEVVDAEDSGIIDADIVDTVRVNKFHRSAHRAGRQFYRMVAEDIERVIDEATR